MSQLLNGLPSDFNSPLKEEVKDGALPLPASAVTWFVPGRIEVFGKHTDYAGGRSLLAAATNGITFVARANSEQVVRVASDAVKDRVELPLQEQIDGYEGGHWAGYAAATVSRLVKNFGSQVRGADITITSNLPLASGMSSSSAMVVGLARCLLDISGIESSAAFRSQIDGPENFAAYLACIENGMSFGELAGHRGVGTFGGSEDHTSMLCAEADSLVQYSFCPVRREKIVPFPADYSFVVAVSGVLAEKTGAAREAYNQVSASAREILAEWNKQQGRDDLFLADAVASGTDAVEKIRSFLPEGSYKRNRFEQFLTESFELVPAAADALSEGDLETFAKVAYLSQSWADQALGNQVPQTRELVSLARSLGACGASAFGAGFGGSVWALVPTAQAVDFAASWRSAYVAAFPQMSERAQMVITRPGGRAQRLALEYSADF
ncbi:galactokinase [Actinomycetaceae bacterium TAE3-ERU4]|nr:galactokinase [Actinomycetaceae bacterium TAE3-ERU4]